MFPETLARSSYSPPAQEALPGGAVFKHKKIKDPSQTDALETTDTLELIAHPRESQSRPTAGGGGEDAGTQHPSVMNGLLPTRPFPCQSPSPRTRPGGD